MNLKGNEILREELAVANQIEKFENVVEKIRLKYELYHRGEMSIENNQLNDDYKDHKTFNLNLPPWLCQPYIRTPPEVYKRVLDEKQKITNSPDYEKREYYDDEGNQISRKRMKRLRRQSRKLQHSQNSVNVEPKLIQKIQRMIVLCRLCKNPMGMKCEFEMCRLCCRGKCRSEGISCAGHIMHTKKFLNNQAHRVLIDL